MTGEGEADDIEGAAGLCVAAASTIFTGGFTAAGCWG